MLRRCSSLLSAFVLLVGTGPLVLAQELPVQLDLGYAAFQYDETGSLLELYLSIGTPSLEYTRTEDGRFQAALPLGMTLRPVAGSAPSDASTTPVFDESLSLRYAVPDTSVLDEGQYFVEQFRTVVPPGEYTLDLTTPADTLAGRPELRLSLDVEVPDFSPGERVTVSGITLASNVQQSEDAEARFYKNGLIVTPNPKALFGEGQDQVYYYLEAYGLPEVAEGEEYTLLSYVSASNLPQPTGDLQRRTTRAVRGPDVLVGAFDVSALPSGSYFLRFAFLDENNEALAEQSKKFFVYNPGVERPVLAVEEGFETSLYAVMSREEVEDNLRHASVVASQPEQAQIRRLGDVEAKREFLARFWQSRDTDSDPATNAARRDFYERLRYINDRYDTPFAEAWETDRGRVVLKYGYPSQVDPRPFDQELVPHEIWTYENIAGQGQALFVFADREGLGRYDLIHTTVTGEVSLANWEQLLRR